MAVIITRGCFRMPPFPQNLMAVRYMRLNQSVPATSRVWRLGLLVIIAVYVVTALLQSLMVPMFEGSDEQRHYAYARYIVNNKTLPPRTQVSGHVEYSSYGVFQEAGQPPLYYAAVALMTAFVPKADDIAPYVNPNPFIAISN